MKAWLKGGLILLSIFVIIEVIYTISIILLATKIEFVPLGHIYVFGGIIHLIINLPAVRILNLLGFKSTELVTTIGKMEGLGPLQIPHVFVFIISGIFLFIIGAIFGWIIGKIKSRGENK